MTSPSPHPQAEGPLKGVPICGVRHTAVCVTLMCRSVWATSRLRWWDRTASRSDPPRTRAHCIISNGVLLTRWQLRHGLLPAVQHG